MFLATNQRIGWMIVELSKFVVFLRLIVKLNVFSQCKSDKFVQILGVLWYRKNPCNIYLKKVRKIIDSIFVDIRIFVA